MSRPTRPALFVLVFGALAVTGLIILIGVFTGHDATIYEDTPDVPPAAYR